MNSQEEGPVDLEIVIPAYNEEHRIDRTLTAYRGHAWDRNVRFLVALDACTDRTAEIVARHAAEDERVEAIELPKLGKGGAIMEGFRRCDASLIGFVDADCATPPAELERLAIAGAEHDGAIGCRRHPSSVLPAPRSLARRAMSAGFALTARTLFGMPYLDTQCGAKVFSCEAVKDALPLLSSRDLLFDIDVLLTMRALGYDIVEVPVVWIDRDGSRMEPIADSRKMATSALRLWIHHRAIPVPENPRRSPHARRREARGGKLVAA
jgi:glycosyltransferase involved in cell wall biosynthesis